MPKTPTFHTTAFSLLSRPTARAAMRCLLALPLLLAAPASAHAEAPSCSQAFTHYYSAGCYITDSEPDTVMPVKELIALCEDIRLFEGDSCQASIDAWLVCLASVPSMASSESDCNCDAHIDRVVQACG